MASTHVRGNAGFINSASLLMCLLLTPTTSDSIPYRWINFDDRLDGVVGIAVEGKPVGVGAFTSNQTILTSANPLYKYQNDVGKITVHAINGAFNVSKSYKVRCMMVAISDNDRSLWARHGFDRKHSPLHDVIQITLHDTVASYRPSGRYPLITRRASYNRYKTTSGYIYAGFGYLDKQHVRENFELEAEIIEEHIVTDCDEWIPRAWGYFICISNVDNHVGVQSGSPLFHRGRLFGVGSFALQKGNESIMVFTDFSRYTHFFMCHTNDNIL